MPYKLKSNKAMKSLKKSKGTDLLIGGGVGTIGKAVKSVAKQTRLERILRSENRGDARVAGRIKELRAREAEGLMSAGERQRALNRMTKSQRTHEANIRKIKNKKK